MTKKKSTGRPKGALNKRTQALRERLIAEGYDPEAPVLGLFKIATRAMEEADGLREEAANADDPLEKVSVLAAARSQEELAVDAWNKSAPYVAPRLKAQELKVDVDSTGNLSINVQPYSKAELKKARKALSDDTAN